MVFRTFWISILKLLILLFFPQARLFDEPQLAALCLETIDKNTPEALGIDLNIRNIFCKPNQKIPLKLYTFQQNISFFRCWRIYRYWYQYFGSCSWQRFLEDKRGQIICRFVYFLKIFCVNKQLNMYDFSSCFEVVRRRVFATKSTTQCRQQKGSFRWSFGTNSISLNDSWRICTRYDNNDWF